MSTYAGSTGHKLSVLQARARELLDALDALDGSVHLALDAQQDEEIEEHAEVLAAQVIRAKHARASLREFIE